MSQATCGHHLRAPVFVVFLDLLDISSLQFDTLALRVGSLEVDIMG